VCAIAITQAVIAAQDNALKHVLVVELAGVHQTIYAHAMMVGLE
jgi:DNA topoisomerase VI subunit A